MNESRLIGGIILFIIIVMFTSYFLITITNPNYQTGGIDIIQIYITQFNLRASGLFTAIADLWENYPPNCNNVNQAGVYFNNINTTDMVLTINNQSFMFMIIDGYLAAVESFISAYIYCNVNSSHLLNAISAYNNFMLVIVGYDIQNNTNGDIGKIYNIDGMGLITPFGKLRRKVLSNDPSKTVMVSAFSDKHGCFIFNVTP